MPHWGVTPGIAGIRVRVPGIRGRLWRLESRGSRNFASRSRSRCSIHRSPGGPATDQGASTVTHIHTADRAIPLTATFTSATAAALAAIVLAIVTALAVLGPFGPAAPTDRAATDSPYVIQSALQWELQR